MLLYVWVACWEFECCREDAVIGSHWGGSLILERANELFDLGVTEFHGVVARPPLSAELPAVATVGSARIGVLEAEERGRQHFRGRLVYEGHGGGPYDDVLDELDCDGVVRRVRGISYDYELRQTSEGEAHVPVAQHHPVDLHSTGDGYPTGRAGHAFPDYLIDLEID